MLPSTVTVKAPPLSVPSDLLSEFENFVLDLDGTVYVAGTALPGLVKAIAFLKSHKKKVLFVTNTSSRDRGGTLKKLELLGFGGLGISEEDCWPSCVFASAEIRRRHLNAKKVFVIGGSGLCEELQRKGFEVVTNEDTASYKSGVSEANFADLMEREVRGQNFEGIVVGWDLGFDFRKLCMAVGVLGEGKDTFFYATNADPFDVVRGWNLPATGALISAIETASGKMAESLGKPNPAFLKAVLDEMGMKKEKTIFVGDRLDTDILMGKNANVKSLFVLTGVHKQDDVEKLGIRPDFMLESFAQMGLGRSAL